MDTFALINVAVCLLLFSLTEAARVTVKVPGSANRVTVDGDFCYVCGGSKGVTIIDMTVPGGPQIVGNYSKYYAHRIVIRDKKAFLAAGDDGFVLLDASDPLNLSFLAQWKIANSFVTGVDSSNGLAYVADYNKGLYVFEMVKLPGQPMKLAEQFKDVFLTALNDVTAKGSKFCVASSALIGSPVYNSSFGLLGRAGPSKEVIFDQNDNILSIESTWGGFEIYTSSEKPTRLYTTTYAKPTSVTQRQTLAFVGTTSAGLCYYTIRTPSATSRLSCLPMEATPLSVSVGEATGYFAVALGSKGVHFLDIETATAEPTYIPTISPTAAPTTVPSNSTAEPTATPTISPTAAPTAVPTATPTISPTAAPTAVPSNSTAEPTATPTISPTAAPTAVPSNSTAEPAVAPVTAAPTAVPSNSTAIPGGATVSPTASQTISPAGATGSPGGSSSASPHGATNSPGGSTSPAGATDSPGGSSSTSPAGATGSPGDITNGTYAPGVLPTSAPGSGTGAPSGSGTISPNIKPDDNNDTKWWLWVIVAIGSLFVIAVILCIICCNRDPVKQSHDYLEDISDVDQTPLHQIQISEASIME